MALLGTTALNSNVKLDQVTVNDAGDDTNMIITVKYHWYDDASLVLRQQDFSTPYAQTPGEINDDLNLTVNDDYESEHP